MMRDLLSAVANHLWQSTVFALAAGLLTTALRNNSARVRHWVWIGASFKFLAPFSLLTALGGYVPWRATPAAAQSQLSTVLNQVSKPFTNTIGGDLAPRAVQHPLSILPAILLAIWAGGFIAIACSWWIRWHRIAATVRAASPLHLDLSVKAVSSPAFSEPGVYGLFRPVLLLPEGIFERLTSEQWQAVLAHEFSHIRHRDNLIGAVQMFVETFFWFHPLVWWMGRQILQEKELACDEEVLRLGNQARVYAQGILNVCALSLESPIACVSGISGPDLRERIDRIIRNHAARELTGAGRILLGSAVALAIAGPVAIGILHSPPVHAQAPASNSARFEVASVRANHSATTSSDMGAPVGNRFTARNVYVKLLMRVGFDVQDFQIAGAPGWTESDRFDIEATAEHSQVTREEYRSMLRSLLTERFGLKAHRETKDAPVFILTASSGGSKLKESVCAKDAAPKACQTAEHTDRGSLTGHFVPISEFTSVLESITGRPVLDRTNLPGQYDIDIRWTPGLAADDISAPSLSTAIEEQLGLKLQSGKGPVSMLIVEHVEHPSGN